MKAKLIKVEDVYRLLREDNLIIGTTDYEYQKAFSDHCYKLSLKNCQAIERGYDLDELTNIFHEQHKFASSHIADITSFKAGFQKALELLGDKKFSKQDMLQAFLKGVSSLQIDAPAFQQSLQQNEWEVEIEMECTQCQSYGYVSECRDNCNKKFLQPKLDADGCLILKRVI